MIIGIVHLVINRTRDDCSYEIRFSSITEAMRGKCREFQHNRVNLNRGNNFLETRSTKGIRELQFPLCFLRNMNFIDLYNRIFKGFALRYRSNTTANRKCTP